MTSGFDNYETSYFDSDRGYTCSYCGNSNLVIDDSFDEYNNYQGTRYYCTCDQAKLEQEMKRKISVLTKNGMLDLIPEVREEYFPKLQKDNAVINKIKFEGDLREFLKDQIYSYHTWLQEKTNVELIETIKEAIYEIRFDYERRQPDDTFEKEDIEVYINNYGGDKEYWEVLLIEDDECYDDVEKGDFTSKEEALAYIDKLKEKYNISIKEY